MTGALFDPSDVTWSTVSTRLATGRRIALTAVVVVVTVVAVVVVADLGWGWYVTLAAAVVGAGALLWGWLIIGRQVRAIGYAERDEEFLVRKGVMWRTVVVVPYARLQYVDVHAGPLDRKLGIARVQLHTASANTDASIPGVDPDEAARLRDRLTERGRSQLAGL